MAVVLNTLPCALPATLTALVTVLKLVIMLSMRSPESETTKLLVVVPTLVAPVLSKTAPLQVPP